MTHTAKILSGVLAATLLVGLGGDQFYHWLFGQVGAQRIALNDVTEELRTKEIQLRQAQRSCETLRQEAVKSLPSEPSQTLVMYQEYLVRLMETCRLTSFVVTSAQPEGIEGLGTILHFSVQGTGRSKEIGKFIDAFYHTDRLDRLAHVNVFQSLGPDSPEHSFSVDIEVLTLNEAEVCSNSKTMEVPTATSLTNLFASRDIFRRPAHKPPKPPARENNSFLGNLLGKPQPPKPVAPKPKPPAPKPPPPPNPKEFVRFVGVIENGDARMAVFVDSLSQRQQSLAERNSLATLGIEAQIVEIRRNSILIQEANELRELPLGTFYIEAVEVN